MTTVDTLINILARDSASPTIRGLAQSYAFVSTAVQHVSGALGKLIDLANNEEQVTRRLNAAMTMRGELTEEQFENQLRLNMLTQQKFGIDNDALAQMQGTLSALGVQNDKLQDATEATLAWAEATGKDMHSAATDVAKALGGNTMMLRRYGLMVNTADEALAALQGKFELVEAQAGSFATQMRRAQANLGDLGEELGFLITKSEGATKAMSDHADALVGLGAIVSDTRTGNEGLVVSYAQLWVRFQKLNPAIALYNELMREAAEHGRAVITMEERIAAAEDIQAQKARRRTAGFAFAKPGEKLPSEMDKPLTEKEKKKLEKERKIRERAAKQRQREEELAAKERDAIAASDVESAVRLAEAREELEQQRLEAEQAYADARAEVEAAGQDAMIAGLDRLEEHRIKMREESLEASKKAAAQEMQMIQQQAQAVASLGGTFGRMAGLAVQGQLEAADAGKMLLQSTLDIARQVVMAAAAKAAAEAFTSQAGIPIVGPLLGAAAASAAFATVSAFVGSFEQGTDFVPRTGFAYVHKGEQIIPADEVGRGQGRPHQTIIQNNSFLTVPTRTQMDRTNRDVLIPSFQRMDKFRIG